MSSLVCCFNATSCLNKCLVMFMKCDRIELFYDCDECISDGIVISFYGINKVILYCIVLYCIDLVLALGQMFDSHSRCLFCCNPLE